MRTQFKTVTKYAEAFLQIANKMSADGRLKPHKFNKIMIENQGIANRFSPYGPTSDGLERKNPLIVALGDSVTAGHFEFGGNPTEQFVKMDKGLMGTEEAVDIVDVRECYLEKFKNILIDKYEITSVSAINSGIAGDTMYGMQKRLHRDVIRYQPDLLLLNGSLNWAEECGDTQNYQKVLREVVSTVKSSISGDIILMTPNMELPGPFANPKSSLDERVEVIRELAEQECLCLADTYKVWKEYEKQGYPVKELLANGMNHPSVVGHEVYAIVLMKLFKLA